MGRTLKSRGVLQSWYLTIWPAQPYRREFLAWGQPFQIARRCEFRTEEMNLEWWREEWMRFLESERSGARTTTSGWFTVLIALVGLFLTTMATLSSLRASNILD